MAFSAYVASVWVLSDWLDAERPTGFWGDRSWLLAARYAVAVHDVPMGERPMVIGLEYPEPCMCKFSTSPTNVVLVGGVYRVDGLSASVLLVHDRYGHEYRLSHSAVRLHDAVYGEDGV